MRPIDAPTAIPMVVVFERVFEVGGIVEFLAVEGFSVVLVLALPTLVDEGEVVVVLFFEQKSW